MIVAPALVCAQPARNTKEVVNGAQTGGSNGTLRKPNRQKAQRPALEPSAGCFFGVGHASINDTYGLRSYLLRSNWRIFNASATASSVMNSVARPNPRRRK